MGTRRHYHRFDPVWDIMAISTLEGNQLATESACHMKTGGLKIFLQTESLDFPCVSNHLSSWEQIKHDGKEAKRRDWQLMSVQRNSL